MSTAETTFTLVFEGLMLFYGPSRDWKSHVAIVNAPQTHHKPQVAFVDKVKGQQEIKLDKDDLITFDLTPGPAKTDSKFNDDVITISDYLRTGAVDNDAIDTTTSDDGVLALVTLPKGDLTALGNLGYKVGLRRWPWQNADERCFPRYVLLGAPTDKDVKITIKKKNGNENSYTIDKEGMVTFSNAAKFSNPKETHFHEYDRLLSTFGWLASAEITNKGCPKFDVKMIPPWLNEDVLKFLEEHYLAVPNGDCGPVDYP